MEINSFFDKSLDVVPEEAKHCLKYSVSHGGLVPWEPTSTRNDDWTYHYAHSGRGLLWAAAIPARSFLNNRLQVITKGYSQVEYRAKNRDDATISMATANFHNTLQNRHPTKLGPAKSVDVTITPAFKEGNTIELQYTPNYIPVYKGALTAFSNGRPSIITKYDFVPRTIVQSGKSVATGRWPTQGAWVSALQGAGCTPTIPSELERFNEALLGWGPEVAEDKWDSRSWFVNVESGGVPSVATIQLSLTAARYCELDEVRV